MNKIQLEIIKKKALEEHIPIIMDDTLEYIYKLYEGKKINTILEIGTAVGYSAICFTKFLNEDYFFCAIAACAAANFAIGTLNGLQDT